ncbi:MULTISPECIES: sensor histidine kinase [Aureimonas]|uniref:sensor histidine kinase n=1 Tax=Aureimonas TaxID=414371 RepID=UPI000733EBF2|nr:MULTISPECIES: DUF4118 domain-containing protein [Aureimonas]
MNLFEVSARVRATPALSWGLALLTFAAALSLRFATNHILPVGFPYLTFFPAVILTAFFGGFWPGVTCAVLSGLSAWYWFIPPFNSFEVHPGTAIALLFYVFVVGVDIALIDAVHRAMDRLQDERATVGRLYEQQRAMFQELQHRVANNMQFVSSLLGLQKRKVMQDPASAAAAFDDARARLDTVSRIHRRLYDPETLKQPIRTYLADLSADILETSGVENIRVEIEMGPEMEGRSFELQHLTTLSLILVEAITNALKHAFQGRNGGTIRVGLSALGNGFYRLSVADNGVGFQGPVDPATSRSLGQRILQSLAQQLGGTIRYVSEGGTRMEMDFSPPRTRSASA